MEVKTGKLKKALPYPVLPQNGPPEIQSVCFSPSNSHLLTAEASYGTAAVWSIDAVQRNTFTKVDGTVVDVAYSPDGRVIGVASYDFFHDESQQWPADAVSLFDREGRLVRSITGRGAYAFCFSPDSRFVAIGYKDHSVAVVQVGASNEPSPPVRVENSEMKSPDRAQGKSSISLDNLKNVARMLPGKNLAWAREKLGKEDIFVQENGAMYRAGYLGYPTPSGFYSLFFYVDSSYDKNVIYDGWICEGNLPGGKSVFTFK